MSDLEDSDVEPDVNTNGELDDDADIDKDDKVQGLSKSLPIKKPAAEYANSDDEADSENEEVDDDDDDDDGLQSDDEMSSLSEDKDHEYNPLENGEDAILSPINSDIDSDDEDELQKFEPESTSEYIKKVHPECLTGNSAEIESLTIITRDKDNQIIDKNHLTNPFLSKYERTRILGQRAKQLNGGCTPYIKVPPGIIDGYLIAELELKEKKIPVIVRRPLPGGTSEYWKLQDLEQIH
jgi:DNA-directed RNA polymerase I, II, and III subunit RPABC2